MRLGNCWEQIEEFLLWHELKNFWKATLIQIIPRS